MSNLNALLIICIIGAIISFIVALVDTYKAGYEKGLRTGWHRGRAVNRQEFWQE
jgi:hypothetical protein